MPSRHLQQTLCFGWSRMDIRVSGLTALSSSAEQRHTWQASLSAAISSRLMTMARCSGESWLRSAWPSSSASLPHPKSSQASREKHTIFDPWGTLFGMCKQSIPLTLMRLRVGLVAMSKVLLRTKSVSSYVPEARTLTSSRPSKPVLIHTKVCSRSAIVSKLSSSLKLSVRCLAVARLIPIDGSV
ncbi:hypothetical protein NEDG_02247 [Nematocida displodere]|uniref:Uncharacterized protein n=1 Tax=Nematocida displodere TaxID=1805483 RepID=A0A177EHG7_9MICR|nr:hypothetical protein NEDG_02247 [Nematocida displodere]